MLARIVARTRGGSHLAIGEHPRPPMSVTSPRRDPAVVGMNLVAD
jgi:hypothetical protein